MLKMALKGTVFSFSLTSQILKPAGFESANIVKADQTTPAGAAQHDLLCLSVRLWFKDVCC